MGNLAGNSVFYGLQAFRKGVRFRFILESFFTVKRGMLVIGAVFVYLPFCIKRILPEGAENAVKRGFLEASDFTLPVHDDAQHAGHDTTDGDYALIQSQMRLDGGGIF